MRSLIICLLVLPGFPPGGPPGTASTAIRAEAQPASVELAPLSGDERLIKLPAVGFALRIEPACAGDTKPRSLSISAADTRLHFSASDLEGAATVEATLAIPESQLGPVRIDNFCRADEDGGPARVAVKDAYTAQLSLRCGEDDRQTIAYATLPLHVDLLCRRADGGEATDQVPAADDPFERF